MSDKEWKRLLVQPVDTDTGKDIVYTTSLDAVREPMSISSDIVVSGTADVISHDMIFRDLLRPYQNMSQHTVVNKIGGFNIGDDLADMSLLDILDKLLITPAETVTTTDTVVTDTTTENEDNNVVEEATDDDNIEVLEPVESEVNNEE